MVGVGVAFDNAVWLLFNTYNYVYFVCTEFLQSLIISQTCRRKQQNYSCVNSKDVTEKTSSDKMRGSGQNRVAHHIRKVFPDL